MISCIGLTKRRPHGQAEEEEEDDSEGMMPMIAICPSGSDGVETFDPLLSPAAHEIRPW